MGRRGNGPSRAVNERTGAAFLESLEAAATPWKCFKGLMLRASLPPGHGMLFRPARGIHTQFMRFPIDLVFLDADDRVVKIREAMPPWRLDWTRAATVIEANAGAARAAGLAVGDRLHFEEVGPTNPGCTVRVRAARLALLGSRSGSGEGSPDGAATRYPPPPDRFARGS